MNATTRGTFLTVAAFAGATICCHSLADDPPFIDNLDHYRDGWIEWMEGDLNCDGRLDWMPWCPAGPDGFLVDDPSGRGGLSLYMSGFSEDLVHVIEAGSGVWEIESEIYIPSSSTGQTYFIVLNEYQWDMDGDGTCDGEPNNVSVQVFFEHFDETVEALHRKEAGGTDFSPLPLVFDEWFTMRVVVDLDNDIADIFYNGEPLYVGFIWSEGVSGGGSQRIESLDWFVTFGESYYDNALVAPLKTASDCIGINGFVQVNRGIEFERGAAETAVSDDEYWVWQPDTIAANSGAPINMVVNGMAVPRTADEIRFNVEVKATPAAATGVVMRVELFDFQSGRYRTATNIPDIASGEAGDGTNDGFYTITVTDRPADLIGPDGEVRARLSWLRPAGVPPFWRIEIDTINWEIEPP